MPEDFNIPSDKFLVNKYNEIPLPTIDPKPSHLIRINELHESLYQKITLYPHTELQQILSRAKNEKSKQYGEFIYDLINRSMEQAVHTIYVMANTNYEEAIREANTDRKERLLSSLESLRMLMELMDKIIKRDKKLVIEDANPNLEKDINTFFKTSLLIGNEEYRATLRFTDYPVDTKNENPDGSKNAPGYTFHKPRISINIYKFNKKTGKLEIFGELRFDLDQTTALKQNPYDRKLVLDINYPNQEQVEYPDTKQLYFNHFEIATEVDFQQFHHFCLGIKNKILEQKSN